MDATTASDAPANSDIPMNHGVPAEIKDALRSQYLAALEMLRIVVARCPEAIWYDKTPKVPFWHVAYHVLFYVHFYLQESEESFSPWPKHRAEVQFLGQLPWPPHDAPEIGQPYSSADVLEYLEFCREEAIARVAELQMLPESGFHWLPFGKFELQLYSLRHLQQHVGELADRLGAQGIETDWVGKV
jgi:hypothetical protein